MNTFNTLAEIEAEKAENLKAFSGIKLSHIKTRVAEILSLIGHGDIFDQYTKHDISHINEMITMLNWLIPKDTQDIMTSSDWLMLVLSIYFHDLGMLVTKSEYENRKNSSFVEYKKKVYNDEFGIEFKSQVATLGENAEKFMYQEYVRLNHAVRIKNWIEGISTPDLGECQSIVQELNDLLKHLDAMFVRDLAKICESHHLNDLDDFTKYKTCVRYGNSDDEVVNVHYIGIILRTVDLLHITSDRTPSIQYRLINPSNPKSIIEWKKQMAVKAISPKSKTDEDGNIDASLPKDTIEVTAYFDQPDQAEAFFGLSSYLMYARKELKHSSKLVQQAIKSQGANGYNFTWKNIDDDNIQTNGFERKLLQFSVDQNNILRLLVGHTLYNDSSVVVRELTQNALDAIKLQNVIESENKIPLTNGNIKIHWDGKERKLSIIDNGTGMCSSDIENYLFNVGSSKYRSEEFQKKYPDFSAISRFGIGILTCFLLANNIDITTNSKEEEASNMISIRDLDGKYLIKKLKKSNLPLEIRDHGTEIVLYIRPEIDMSELESDIRKWVVFPYCQLSLQIDQFDPIIIGYKSPKVALETYLQLCGYQINDKIKIVQDELDGVTLAYAVEYSEYLKEWNFISSKSSFRTNVLEIIPYGTCVEGIRVEFDTPGFNSKNILAIANIVGNNTAKTNVARSAIEKNEEKDALLSTVYTLFSKHIKQQLEQLKKSGYSLAWATAESKYLIEPLVPRSRRDEYGPNDEKPIEPQNPVLLFEALNKIKCMIIEKNCERVDISPNELEKIDEIYIVDSKMIRAAEMLLREIRANTTLCSLINAISEDEDNKLINMENIISNFDNLNILHKNALSGKQVVKIDVQKRQRRINLLYQNTDAIWSTFKLADSYRRRPEVIHIPKSDFTINGLTEEIGVKTFDGIFLSYNNDLTQYVVRQLKRFDYENNGEHKVLLEILLSTIFNSSMLSLTTTELKGNFDETFSSMIERGFGLRISKEFEEKLWNIIDKNELMTQLFKEKNYIYNPSVWSRTDKN